MSTTLSQEDFQDYMDGGLRRRRAVRSATKRPVAHKAKPKAVAKRPVAAKRPSSKMAKLFGGFFESLEDSANETAVKEKKAAKVETYADDKNPMAPLAVKGGKPKPKAKKPKAKAKKPRAYPGLYMGGFEEEQYQDQEEQEQSEEFMNINEALTQAKQLISGGYYRPRAAVRRVAPARPRRASSPRRAAPAVRRAAPARRRVVRRSV
jgi:hypothetical protein